MTDMSRIFAWQVKDLFCHIDSDRISIIKVNNDQMVFKVLSKFEFVNVHKAVIQ